MRLLATAAAAMLISSSASAVQFVNGSFEDGVSPGSYTSVATGDTSSIAGWEVLSSGVDYIGSYWQASDGDRSLDLSALTSGGILQVLGGFEIGKHYRITFDLSANPDEATRPKRIVVSATSGSSVIYDYSNTANTTADMQYLTLTYDFTATNTTQHIQFRSLEENPYGAVLDNVVLSVVPEPATWGLMIAGFMLVGAAARRRKGDRSAAA